MNVSELKSAIEKNRGTISQLLSGGSFKRLNSFNWVRHELTTEAQILFQLPSHYQKKQFIDYNNLKNLGTAWDYILENSNTRIDCMQIRTVHSMLCKNTDIPGGIYRLSDIYSEQLGIHAPPSHKVIYMMDDIEFNLYNSDHKILTRAFNIHFDLIALQPFNDFNKRTARLIMNWYLIQNGYRPILFNHKTDKQNYMQALRARAHNDCKTYSKYMYECLYRTQKSIIKILEGARGF